MNGQELWRVFVELQPETAKQQLANLREVLNTSTAQAWQFVARECGIDATTPPEFAARRVREWLANGCAANDCMSDGEVMEELAGVVDRWRHSVGND